MRTCTFVLLLGSSVVATGCFKELPRATADAPRAPGTDARMDAPPRPDALAGDTARLADGSAGEAPGDGPQGDAPQGPDPRFDARADVPLDAPGNSTPVDASAVPDANPRTDTACNPAGPKICGCVSCEPWQVCVEARCSPQYIRSTQLPATRVRAHPAPGGGFFLTGTFNGVADFDLGPGAMTRTARGAAHGFVARYTADGALSWAQSFGGSTGSDDVVVNDLAVAADGSVAVVGNYSGTVDFIGSSQKSGGEGWDGFLLKLTTGGTFSFWRSVRSTQAAYQVSGMNGVAVASDGAIFAGGFIRGRYDLAPGDGGDLRDSGARRAGYLSRYSAAGARQWSRLYTSTETLGVSEVAAGDNGGVWFAGYVAGTTADLDGDGISDVTPQGDDVFLVNAADTGAKMRQWTWLGGGSKSVNHLERTSDGSVLMAGVFRNGAMDLDPGPGTDVRMSKGEDDAWALKLGADGAYRWGFVIAGNGFDNIGTLTATADDGAVLVGRFTGPTAFIPGDLREPARGTLAILRLAADGAIRWAVTAGPTSVRAGEHTSAAVLPSGLVVSTSLAAPGDFDPGAGDDPFAAPATPAVVASQYAF